MAISLGFRWFVNASRHALTEFIGLRERGILAAMSWMPTARKISKRRCEARRPKPNNAEKVVSSRSGVLVAQV
jgi:hypothetical protein